MLKRARLCCELCGVSGINSGEMDGQTVFHCHLHLIPRREGDTEDPTGGVRNAFAGKGAYRGVLRPDRGRLPQRHRRRSAVTSAEIARGFVEKGWQIRYRGGNSVCSTPSDLNLVVADAPRDPPRYSIAAWPLGAGPSGRRGLVLDLYDADRGVAARVRRVPTPERAAELLARYGVPANEAGGAPEQEAPMVPEGAEAPVRLRQGAGSAERL